MAFSTSEFQDNIGTLAHPALFEVIIGDMDLKFECKATTIPGGTIGVIELPYKNKKSKIPGERTFPDWTITVYNKEDYSTRQAFEQWQEDCAGANNGSNGLPSEVKRTGVVKKLDKDGNYTGVEYDIVGIWPSELGDIEQSFDSTDAFEEFTVTFTVDYAGNAAIVRG